MVKHKGIGRFVCPKISKFVNNEYISYHYHYQRHVELQSFQNTFLSLRESERVKLLFIKN